MKVVFSCFISVVFSSYFWFVTVLYICVGCWIFVLFNIPGLYFFLFFNRVTKQDNIFWSFDISLIMSIEESYNWIFSVLNANDGYNFFFLWQGRYMDKNLYFSVGSTPLNVTLKYSCNTICSLKSPVYQAGSAVK